ncbi:MAG: sulfatase [Candidatus Cyclobacteriaceae bacterium M3_2C_046]
MTPVKNHKVFKLMWLFFFACLSTLSAQSQYNVLFIMVDDLRPQIGSYGKDFIHSPYMDKLAEEGIQFNRAYCNVPVCGASRASLLTSIRPYWPHRFRNYKARVEQDCPDVVTLPQLFKEHGYHTISNGKIFHYKNDMASVSWTEPPWRPDFSRKIDAENSSWLNPASRKKINPETQMGPYFESANVPDTAYYDGQVAAKSIRDLQRLARQDQPFFLAVGFNKPHLPFNAPQKYFDLYQDVEMASNRFAPKGLPRPCTNSREIFVYGGLDDYNSPAFHQEARKAYYACVSYVDAQIGLLLENLERLQLDRNTIVVILGDHGWHLGEHNFWGKHNALHNALHAPLIIKMPGMPAAKINQIVEYVDIYPTIADLTGIKIPGHVQGKSLKNIMKGKDEGWKNYAFTEWQGARTLITPGFAYTYWFEQKHAGAHMLYNHQTDPDENSNVADDPAYKQIIHDHQKMLNGLYDTLNISFPY